MPGTTVSGGGGRQQSPNVLGYKASSFPRDTVMRGADKQDWITYVDKAGSARWRHRVTCTATSARKPRSTKKTTKRASPRTYRYLPHLGNASAIYRDLRERELAQYYAARGMTSLGNTMVTKSKHTKTPGGIKIVYSSNENERDNTNWTNGLHKKYMLQSKAEAALQAAFDKKENAS